MEFSIFKILNFEFLSLIRSVIRSWFCRRRSSRVLTRPLFYFLLPLKLQRILPQFLPVPGNFCFVPAGPAPTPILSPRQKIEYSGFIKIKMEVCLSGCVFSSLIYELENSEGDVVSGSLLNI